MKNYLAINSKDYQVFDLSEEYPGYEGEQMYAIASDMTEGELFAKYEDEISQYWPFILISIEMGVAMVEHNNCNCACHMRECRNMEVSFDSLKGTDEGAYDFAERYLAYLTDLELQKSLVKLSELQARRAYKYLWQSKTFEQIAKEESCNVSTVRKSVISALKRLYELNYGKEMVV